MIADEREHLVYGYYDATDRLIYVGCTANPEMRTMNHRAQSWWWRQVAREDMLAVGQSKAEGRALERQAILGLRPRWNRTPMPPRERWTAEDYMDQILCSLATRSCFEYAHLGWEPQLHDDGKRLVLDANAYFDLDLPIEPVPLLRRVGGDVRNLPASLLAPIKAGPISDRSAA